MQKVIDQITDHLVTLVTTDKESYNPKELLKSGIPSFVVERIRLLLEDKVKEEIGIIKPIWFNIDTKLVADSLKDYIRSAVSSSHIPKSHLYDIINTVIKDIVYVFVEPRKNMAEYIFRENDVLTLHEIEERCNRLTIYKHFGAAIPLYMKKRDLETLSKDRCKDLIFKFDTKLVAAYTAQDWAQKLEQLFILFGGKLNPILLSTFFEDKGLYGMAGKFEQIDGSLTKKDFISIISSEDINAFNPELRKKGLDEVEKEIASKEAKKLSEKDDREQALIEGFFGNYETPDDESQTLVGQFADGSLSDEEMSELLSDIAGDGVVELDSYEQVDSLNKLFSLNNEEDEDAQVSETSEEIAAKLKEQNDGDAEEIIEFRENLVSILDQAKHSFENIDKKEDYTENVVEQDLAQGKDEEETKDTESSQSDNEDQGEELISNEEAEAKPVWAQFINEDQMEVLLGGERNKASENPEIVENSEEEEEIEVDDVYTENPFIEENKTDDLIDLENDLKDILEDRKLEFIEVIFKGSEIKYDKALNKFDEFKNWKEASKFIQKEVFLKNDVDMFTGATVDFTDRIHQYFNGKNNS
ncbi:MAG: hypothetical protein RLN90_09450 [Balneolaceae bacterium]